MERMVRDGRNTLAGEQAYRQEMYKKYAMN